MPRNARMIEPIDASFDHVIKVIVSEPEKQVKKEDTSLSQWVGKIQLHGLY